MKNYGAVHVGTWWADVLLKMVGADEHMAMFNSHALNWLGRTSLVDLLTQRLSSEYDVSESANASIVLQAISKASPTGLSSILKSPATVHKLMAMAAEAATNAKSIDHICFPFQVSKLFCFPPWNLSTHAHTCVCKRCLFKSHPLSSKKKNLVLYARGYTWRCALR